MSEAKNGNSMKVLNELPSCLRALSLYIYSPIEKSRWWNMQSFTRLSQSLITWWVKYLPNAIYATLLTCRLSNNSAGISCLHFNRSFTSSASSFLFASLRSWPPSGGCWSITHPGICSGLQKIRLLISLASEIVFRSNNCKKTMRKVLSLTT